MSNKSLYWALGVVVAYYLLLSKIVGSIGHFVFLLVGWAIPILFLFFLGKYLATKFEGCYRMSKKMFILFFIVFFVVISLTIDKTMYPLHTVGGDEGCMCMYFSYGGGRIGSEKEYGLSNIDAKRYLLYTTESFIKGFHLGF